MSLPHYLTQYLLYIIHGNGWGLYIYTRCIPIGILRKFMSGSVSTQPYFRVLYMETHSREHNEPSYSELLVSMHTSTFLLLKQLNFLIAYMGFLSSVFHHHFRLLIKLYSSLYLIPFPFHFPSINQHLVSLHQITDLSIQVSRAMQRLTRFTCI